MWTKRKAIKEASNAISLYQRQEQQLEDEFKELVSNFDSIKEKLDNSYLSLAQSMLGKSLDQTKVELYAEQILPSLLSEFNQLETTRAAYLIEHSELCSHPTVINREALVDAPGATLSTEYHEAKEYKLAAESNKASCESPSFMWLFRHNAHLKSNDSGFQKLWKFITLHSVKARQHEKKVQDEFGKSFGAVALDYRHYCEVLTKRDSEYSRAEANYHAALKLLKRYDYLAQWDHSYEQIANEQLVTHLAQYLALLADEDLIQKVPPSSKLFVGEICAQRKKLSYLKDLSQYLKNEIADRGSRIHSINRVRRKWRRKPSGYVGNKTKWLCTIPSMKVKGTSKRIGWSSSMRSNLIHFDAYDHYSRHLYLTHHYDTPFLAYDIFNSCSSYRMPYDGFSSEVIEELTEFREEVGDATWIDAEYTNEEIESDYTLEEAVYVEPDEAIYEEEEALEDINTEELEDES